MNELSLQFVYNARSGKVNALFDIAHKLISPDTYACDLCQLTHDTFRENAAFTALKAEFPIELLHIDEYESRYPAEPLYPVIIARRGQQAVRRFGPERISQLHSVADLRSLIESIDTGQADTSSRKAEALSTPYR